MNYFPELIERLSPFSESLIVNDVIYDKKKVLDFCSQPAIESMFVFLANAKNIMLFNKPLLHCEVIGGSSITTNWLGSAKEIAISEIAPVIFDIWVSDLGASATLTRQGLDLSLPVEEWRSLASSINGVIPPSLIVENLFEVAIEQSDLHFGHRGISAAIHLINSRRVDLENDLQIALKQTNKRSA